LDSFVGTSPPFPASFRINKYTNFTENVVNLRFPRSAGFSVRGSTETSPRTENPADRVVFLLLNRRNANLLVLLKSEQMVVNNDVLRSIRYALDLSDAKVVDIIKLAGHDPAIVQSDIPNLLKKEEEEGFVACSDEVMTAFLDGLIIHKRGKLEPKPEQKPGRGIKPHQRLTNNAILKKLRVAFELKEEDMHKTLELAGFGVSKPELSALFRAQGHNNYRACGDQFLRNFLKGLVIRQRE